MTRVVIVCSLLLGCGSACPRLLAEHRERIQAPTAEPAGPPHVQLNLSRAWVEGRLKAEVVGRPPIPIKVPGFADFAPGLSVAVTDLGLEDGGSDAVVVRLSLSLRHGRAPILGMSARVRVRPTVDLRRRRVSLALRGRDLKALRLTMPRGAEARLAAALKERLPPAARPFATASAIRRAAKAVLDGMSARIVSVTREYLPGRVRLEAALPTLPLSRLRLRVSGDRIPIDGWLDRPIDSGLRGRARVRGPIVLRAAGGAVTELLNRAIATGAIGGTYDAKGKADPDGPYAPVLAWAAGASRPLQVHVYRLVETCVRVRLDGRPSLHLTRGGLEAGIRDATVEEVDGPPLAAAAIWIGALWKDAIHITRRVADRAEISLGGRRAVLKIRSAAVIGDEIRLGLSLAGGR